MFEQVKLKRPVACTEQSEKNIRALTKLHAQVLKLNKTVKEASGEKHLRLVDTKV